MANDTMSVAIVGAGQSALQLGFGLLADGIDVTILTDRDAAAIRSGRVLSTQCMFDMALDLERDLGIDHWQHEAPQIPGIRYSVGTPDGTLATQVFGRLSRPAQSVDQRIKMGVWLEQFATHGGNVVLDALDIDRLERLAEEHDLLVIASGKGALRDVLATTFPRDPARSPYDRPQRTLAVAYLDGFEPLDSSYFSINIVPGVGECFIGPALTLSGSCYTACFEAIPGGPMDAWNDVSIDDEREWLGVLRELLLRYVPWESDRWSDEVRLTDAGGTLKGALTPTVRNAAGRLPSGRPVLGLGDMAVLNDPLVGQGANNAAKSADVVRRAIRGRAGGPLDAAWIEATAERCWKAVRYPTAFTNLMLNPPEHIGTLFDEAAASEAFANRLADGSSDPSTLFPWLESAEGIRRAAADATEAASGTVPR